MHPEIVTTSERMVYSVASEKHGNAKRYRVDLLANNGAGACSCTDFCTRRQPNLDDGMPPMGPFTCCKHLRKAQLHFLLELLQEMAKSEEAK